MTKRLLVTTGLAVAAVLMFFVPSATAQYQPTGTQVLSESVVRPGQTITVSGTGCPAGSTVITRFETRKRGVTVADTNGAFALQIVIPSSASPGTHTITSTCGTLVLSSTITVRGSSVSPGGTGNGSGTGSGNGSASGSPLARTGTNSTIPLTQIGVGLLAFGGIILIVGRKRRHSVAA